MLNIRYCLVALLLFCYACSGSTSTQPPIPPNPPDTSGDGGATPINITLPTADFTNVDLVAQGKPSSTIINRLTALVDATPKGGSIYMSFYFFDNERGLMKALGNAEERGVKVHVMLDVGVGLKTNMPTIKTLKAIAPDIDIVKIDNGIQNGAINHNKFTLFSDISTKGGKAKNVVFTSSDNLSPHQQELIQNAAILSDKGLYQAYLGYWQAMKKLADRKMKNYTFKKYSDPDAGIWAYFFPKRKNGNVFGPDPIIKVLDGITDPSSATIQIEMPFWTKYRMRTDVSLDGISIVGKLSKLMKQGAKVEAVVRSNVDNHDSLVALAHQGAFIKMYNYSDVPNVKQIGLHSKVMLIQGEWHGNKTKLAIVGSQNFGGRPLIASNNNTLVLSSYHFKHPQFFKLYEDNFNELKKLSGVCCAEKD